MCDSPLRSVWPALLCAGFVRWLSCSAAAQPFAPADVGTTVNGYQDDFDGASLAAGWLVLGANAYAVSNGALHVATPAGDPNHLLYAVAGYNNSVQEVLARIRVLNFGTGDPPRGGVGVCVDPAASPAGGIDLHFRDENLGRHIEFLDDLRAWGNEYQFAWQNNTWYWLRLRHEPNAASQGGVNDVFGKIWLADGTQPEPATWQNLYDYTPARTARTGYAGLVAGSSGGTSELEVDYVLIKASGLPGITVAPSASVQTPVTITNQPQSQNVTQCRPVTFTVGCNGTPPFTFQWFRGGVAISGASNDSYTVPAVQLSDHGAVFRVVASNVASNTPFSANSSNAVLSVSADTAPPSLLGAANNGIDQILVTFSEPVTAATANDKSNYSITNASGAPLPILSATLAASLTNVLLVTTGQVEGVTYTLTVNHISDQCTALNVIAPNSQATFLALAYSAADIGSPTPPGGAVLVAGGYDVTGGGGDIGGTSDQFQFSSQQRSGDFDVKVRIGSLGLSDAWAEAGLMARETLAAGSRFASVMATPTISGSYFQSRAATGGATAPSGSFPVNYPNTWLRLQRVGSQFTGHASFDGQGWTRLGTVSLALPANLFFGFAVSSHNTNLATTAAFRDLSAITTLATNALPPAPEPLGQSSRETSLVISEIMYHPGNTRGTMNTNAQGFVTNSLEFVELFNALGTPENIGGFRLSGSIDYTFPPGTVIPGGGFLVVARFPTDLQGVCGITGVLGPFTNNLPNSAGTVRLRNPAGAILLEVNYDSAPPWPAAADGAGHSLVLARASFGENDPRAWGASDAVGGSPGRLDPVTLHPLRHVVINEFLAHTDPPDLDFIELYNPANQPLDLSGCSLSDDPDTNKFVLPSMTIIPARGFLAWNQDQLGFALKAGGETLFLRDPAGTRVLDAVRYEAQAGGVSFGRSPDGAPTLRALSSRTPGAGNAAFLSPDIVINEILFNPISRDDDDQFIELYNKGTGAVNIGDWKFTAGINFTFASNTILNPDSYLVVARNGARMLLNYTNLNPGSLVGDLSGRLSHTGERLALARPDLVVSTNSLGALTTNLVHVVVNEVTYGAGGRWGRWSDGGGSSLELIDAHSDNRLAANWADSDETAKAPWTAVSTTGTLDNGNVSADQLQVLLQGPGECLIDDVQVLNSSSANLIANSTFEIDATGWTAEGTEQTSSLETSEGYNSTRCYHVRAVERGDNQPNRIRTPLTAALASGATATLRAKVRWLRGQPSILFRLRGNWLEAVGNMTPPQNPGTPGARNSRAATNGPPAISDVTHTPILPAASQPCIVTARVHDPNAPVALLLKYRLDPAATYSTVTMEDTGAGGDAVAADGIYSATIPGQPSGTLVAFYLQATDNLLASSLFPDNAPARECLVRFGEIQPAGNFPVYRLWMTAATLNTWNGRSKLDNTPLDVTFVLGSQRVIYNSTALYAGSPYIAPGYGGATSGRCGYSVTFPADDLFLGDADLVLDWPGGHGGENTALQEQMAYWIAARINLPACHRYHVRLHVNGVTDDQRSAVFEAVNQPGGDFVKAWVPDDSDGDFYKVDRGFEFSDAGGLTADPQPRLENYTTTGGVKKEARYRWNWSKRASDSANDHTNIFNLADALNAASPEPYTSQVSGLVDIDEWMGILAMEHIIVNFDAYGHEIGKNMYVYKPRNGKWQMYMFDLDWLMLAAPGHNGSYAASSAPLFNSEDPTITRMYNHPPFRRAYFRTVQDAVDGPLLSSQCDPVMDAKYASLVANGVQFCDGSSLAAPTAVKTWFSQRRAALVSQLAAVASPFTVGGPSSFSTSSNLVTLSGTAPITITTITLNGLAWPVTWTTVSNWTLRLPLGQMAGPFTVLGYDKRGNLVNGASNQLNITYTGVAPSPQGVVVINEVMYHPLVPHAEFVELFNTSSNLAFDLSGWRFNGLDYTFPSGSFIGPRSFLVLVKDRAVAFATYGTNLLIFDEFSGNLQTNGETLTLIQPGAAPGLDVSIDRVRYEGAAPWPAAPNGAGPSLQLIDAAQDNSRAGNWSGDSGWSFASRTGNILTATNLLLWLSGMANAYIDDITLIGPGGTNIALNGDFETDLSPAWILSPNYATSMIVSNVSHSGRRCLFLNGTSTGGTLNSSLQQYIVNRVVSNATYTLSFWCLANTNPATVNTRTLPGSNLILPAGAARILATPGATNVSAATLPPFPALWINEVQPENVSGVTDNNGQRDPWIELYNAGPSDVPLDGFYLADNYANLSQWTFPAGAVIGAGEFKVIFADGEPLQSAGAELHTSFRLSAGSGSVALSRPYGGAPQVLDYVNYSGVGAGRSYGSFPDGQPFDRQEFYHVTAGGANNSASAPITVFINEWMAENTGFLIDPGTGRYEDWFEIYNPADLPAELGGYSLTDTLTNRFKYQVPAGYRVPAHGFLMVWADSDPSSNSSNSPALHVNFKLDRLGEAIGLFSPDGLAIDTVVFGAQTENISEGRYPDGTATKSLMSVPTPAATNIVTVELPPQLAGVSQSANQFSFSWQSQTGRTVQVEYTDDLAGAWAALGAPVAGTGAPVTVSYDLDAAAHRFFRLRVIP